MALVLFYHPLASFCHKVLIALYENGTPFEGEIIRHDLPQDRAALLEAWPVGKMPVLRDEAREVTMPESSLVLEYIDTQYPGPHPLLPRETLAALQARLWDRFFDNYVQVPMQKHVADRLRPAGQQDAYGVAEAASTLDTAYTMLETHLTARQWMLGEDFSMADCAAAPALFYAGVVHPFSESRPALVAYFERLMARPSVHRTLQEAAPFMCHFPFRQEMPQNWGGVTWPPR